jgi:hypothetical protein
MQDAEERDGCVDVYGASTRVIRSRPPSLPAHVRVAPDAASCACASSLVADTAGGTAVFLILPLHLTRAKQRDYLIAMPCHCCCAVLCCAATRFNKINRRSRAAFIRSACMHSRTAASQLPSPDAAFPSSSSFLLVHARAWAPTFQSATVGPAAAPSLSWSPYANGGYTRQGTAQSVSVACRPWTRCTAPPTGGQMRACASLPW